MKKQTIGKNGYILLTIVLVPVLILIILSNASVNTETEILKLSDLEGKQVGVQSGTLYEDNLKKTGTNADIVFYTDPYSMLLAVEQGKLDAALQESISFTIEQKSHPKLAALDESIGTMEISAAFGETDRKYQLYDQFESFLREIMDNGTLDELNEYWFDNYSDQSVVDKSGITGENGKLTVAVETTYEPFEYIANGEYQGFDIDLIYRFAREYGYEPEIKGMDFDAISTALSSGKYDIGMNLVSNEEREDAVLLSTPYSEFEIIVVTGNGEAAEESFIDSLKDSFRKTFIVENRWKELLNGLSTTLFISIVSIITGFILGTLAYVLCYEKDLLANRIMDILCGLFGNLPSVVILLIMYYIVFGKVIISDVAVSVITFSLMFTCSVFSITKSGVAALGDGQYEAARAQGLSSGKTFFKIIYPQVLMNQFSSLQDEMGTLVKETAIVGYIATMDLTRASDVIRGRTFEPFFPLIVSAVIYFLLIKLLTSCFALFIKNIRPETRNAEKIIEKKKRK